MIIMIVIFMIIIITSVEPLGTDISLIRTVSNVPKKISKNYQKNLHNTESL